MHPLTKVQLLKEIQLFIRDKDRGISIDHFAEVAGITEWHIRQVFDLQTEPLTEYGQRRVNRAYMHWKEGKLKVMVMKNRKRFVDYRKEPQPAIIPTSKLIMTDSGFKVQNKPLNRHDYANFDNILLKT